ncbi:MAG: LysM peptidoglycan-binding domain-containing protein, partial [Bacteroidetes bacterium]|nr:LysM peptidoglycan-binding domain-containing protein [Bacteroidota bacterium]
MNRIFSIAVSLMLLLVVLNGCKTTKKTGGIKVEEVSYVDPYLGKMESELSVSELYIKKYRDLAIAEMKRAKIPASVTLAQGILESGNGNSYLAKKANNHFGIKCGSSWKGEAIYFDDDEANECFRKYTNSNESYLDHSNFLTSGQRYAGLFELDILDYQGWARGLKSAGYATRRNYAELLIDMIDKHNLTAYDVAVPKDKSSKVVYQADEQFKYNGISAILAKENDTYNEIAKRNSIAVGKLLEYNDLKEPIPLKTGAVVYLGPKKTVAKESYHIVKKKDRMYTIAQEYGIKLDALYQKNLMKANEEAAVGEILYLRQKRSDPAEKRVIEEDEEKIASNEKTVAKDPVKDEEKVVVTEKPVKEEPAKDTKVETPKESSSKIVFEDDFEEVPITNTETTPVVADTKVDDSPQESNTVNMHKVQAGETLYSIAQKYGVSVDELKRLNNMQSNELSLNDKLIISKTNDDNKVESDKSKTIAEDYEKFDEQIASDTIFHIVKADESFYSISRNYKMTIIDLIALNNLKEYKIEKGQKLIIKLPEQPVASEPVKEKSTSADDFFIKPKATTPDVK